MVEWALRQKARRDPAFTYEWGGRRVTATGAELEDGINPVAAKVWMMRDVPTRADNDCRVRRGATSNQGS